MARKRTPCEFCETENFISDEYRNCSIWIEFYPDNGHIAITVQGRSDDGEMTSEDDFEIPFEYCPKCGRKLGF